LRSSSEFIPFEPGTLAQGEQSLAVLARASGPGRKSPKIPHTTRPGSTIGDRGGSK